MLKAIVGLPTLRSTFTGIIDIPVTLIDDDSRDISILKAEVSQIIGGRTSVRQYMEDGGQIKYLDTDPLQPALLNQLASSPTGTAHTLVWDSKGHYSEAIKPLLVLRVTLDVDGVEYGPYYSPEFSLTSEEENTSLAPYLVERGETATLKAVFFDGDGELYDPDTVELTSLVDSNGTELLGGAQASTQVSTGVYTNDYAITDSNPLGDYIGTFRGVLEATEVEHKCAFQVIDKIFMCLAADDPDNTVVFGRLFDGNGKPLVGVQVKYYISECEPSFSTSLVSKDSACVTTDSNGEFRFTAVRQSRVTVSISCLRYKRTSDLPDVDCVDFLDLTS